MECEVTISAFTQLRIVHKANYIFSPWESKYWTQYNLILVLSTRIPPPLKFDPIFKADWLVTLPPTASATQSSFVFHPLEDSLVDSRHEKLRCQ